MCEPPRSCFCSEFLFLLSGSLCSLSPPPPPCATARVRERGGEGGASANHVCKARSLSKGFCLSTKYVRGEYRQLQQLATSLPRRRSLSSPTPGFFRAVLGQVAYQATSPRPGWWCGLGGPTDSKPIRLLASARSPIEPASASVDSLLQHTLQDAHEVVQAPQIPVLTVPFDPRQAVRQSLMLGERHSFAKVNHPHPGQSRLVVDKQ